MKKLYFVLAFLCSLHAYAQTPTIPPMGVEITKAIPASADAAALGKYGRVPVSPFTGIPNISIPIYTIKSGDLTLPVSISYHAGGIKVEETASSVGLGWALNAGGVITRTVRGLPDEDQFGYLDPANNVYDIYHSLFTGNGSMSTTAAGQLLNYYVDGTRDGEADIFNFNFAGYSGQFVFSPTAGIMISPQQNINFMINYAIGTPIASIIAQTPDGVKYYFGDTYGVAGVEQSISSASHGSKTYNMSWMLTKIISPSGSEIDFTYKAGHYTQYQPGGTHYRLTSGDGLDLSNQVIETDNDNGSSTGMHTMQLTKITFENGALQIYNNMPRLDIPGENMVDSLAIISPSLNKLYHFYYTNSANTRLRLDSLIGQLDPIPGTSNYKKEKYYFTYNGDAWSSNSNFQNAQDWWGFYNGYNQTTLVPWEYDPLNSTQKLPGAERKPVDGAMNNAMLTSIHYPTGGYTNFTFEPNQEADYDFGSDTYQSDPNYTAISNDPASIYNNYDNNNGNPNNLMHVYSTSNPNKRMPVHLIAYGLQLGFNPPPRAYSYLNVLIFAKDAQGNYTNNVYAITNTDTTIYLDQGYYQLQFRDPKNQTNPDVFTDTYKYEAIAAWSNEIPVQGSHFHGHTAGGMRIASIADYDGISSTPYNVRSYKYLLNDTTSSGFTFFKPEYYYNLTSNTGTWQNIKVSTYYVRTAASNYPLATQQGAVVGYYHVEEDQDNSGFQGKTEYDYSINGQGINLGGFPFAPPTTMDWLSGLLTHQATWKNTSGNTFAKLQEKVNIYKSMRSDSCISIKAGFNPYPSNYNQDLNYYGGTQGGTGGTAGTLLAQPYLNATNFNYLASDTTWTYDGTDPSKYTKTWDNYQYNPGTLLLNRLQTINSKNEVVTQSVTYSGDAPIGVRGVSYIHGLNIQNYPVEEVTQLANADGSNARTVKAVLTSYKVNQPYRDTVFEARSITPITNFVPVTGGSARDNRYQPVISFDKYDKYGNIVQERKVGDAPHTYLWGYTNLYGLNNTYPIAEIVNADSANVAYTNFESYDAGGTGCGNWVYNNATATDATAPMGSQYFTLSASNNLVKTGLNTATTYTVSYWYKTGASITVTGGTVTSIATGKSKLGWIYHEVAVTGAASVTISGTGKIDEVRLYPKGALMNTYTYLPLVGMGSKSDTKSDITYYNFDTFGRLSQVLDNSRDILKDFQYNYVTQGPVWVDNNVTQCVTDFNGNNTGEEQMQQIDTNPYSVSYGRIQWRSMGSQPGACPPPPVWLNMKLNSTNTHNGLTTNIYEFDLYSNAACTTLYTTPTNFTINYTQVTSSTTPPAQVTVNRPLTVPANAHGITLTVQMNDCGTTGGTSGCTNGIAPIAGTGYTLNVHWQF